MIERVEIKLKEKMVYRFQYIDFVLIDKELQLPDDYKNGMEENWSNEIASGKTYTNGKIYTISGYNFDNDKKKIYIQQSSYSHYLYSKKREYDIYSCRSMASNALFLTSDNYFVLGKMKNTTSLPGKIKFIGGSVAKEDINSLNKVDVEECIKRECNEEIGIDITDKQYVENIEPIAYITRKHLTFVNTLFCARLSKSKNEMEKLFKDFQTKLIETNEEVELQDVVFVHNDKESVIEFLENKDNNLIDYMKDFFETYFEISDYGNFDDYVKKHIKEIKVKNEK